LPNGDPTIRIQNRLSTLRPQLIWHPSKLFNLLDTVLVALMGLYSRRISLQLGELLGVDLRASRDDGKRHQDVGSGEGGTAEVLAIVGRRGELGFQEAEVGGVVCREVGGVDFVGDAAGDGLDEEGDGSVTDVWFCD
jgi:hypothetical protein